MLRRIHVEIVGDASEVSRFFERARRAKVSRLLPWQRRPLARMRYEIRRWRGTF